MKSTKPSTTTSNFPSLSVKDLIEARDLFHLHLMNKKNVIATAIGKYRLRLSDLDKDDNYKPKNVFPREVRTLENSKVVPKISWPCVLVFIKEWQDESDLIHDGGNNIIPRSIYMPDGRVVPICIVKVAKSHVSDIGFNESRLMFPKNLISGGFPLVVYSQKDRRIASVGCLVTDGNKVFAITNKHVTGKVGTEIFTVLKGEEVKIGVSSDKQLGKGKFTELYPGWVGSNVLINNDVGLIEVDDVNMWKTEVFGIGKIDEIKDVNTNNLTLDLINQKVIAYGAVSKNIEGEIVAFFYRYKSLGGIEYVSDFLIGGVEGKSLNVHHGDSGTLWLLEETDPDTGEVLKHPLALHWGQHEFIRGNTTMKRSYAMATCLSNVCRELDVDLLRGWNLDQDYTWAKDGHFKVGNRAAILVSDKKLSNLLTLNQSSLGYSDALLKQPTKIAKAKSEGFIPLADVADLWWRYKRFKTEGSNHFADMDESNKKVENGKDLLTLCKNDSFIDIKKWVKFYQQLDVVDPKTKINRETKKEEPAPRAGSLPFRVWQMYSQMVNSLKAGEIEEFICVGGTMAHYVGDACQPLHVSYLHAGVPGEETNVHGDFEDSLLAKNQDALFGGVNAIANKVKSAELIKGGKASAKLVIELMRKSHKTLPPMDIINVFDENKGRGKYQKIWGLIGGKTIQLIADGAHCMAVLWQSAWEEGGGKNIPASKIKKSSLEKLKTLYKDYRFVQSFTIDDPKFEKALNKDSRTL